MSVARRDEAGGLAASLARSSAFLSLLRDVALLAGASGLIVALRIMERAEIWHGRTLILVAIATIGGAGGGIVSAYWVWLVGRQRSPRARMIIAALAFPVGFILAMGVAYVVQTLGIAGHHEGNPARRLASLAYSAPQTFGLFLISVPVYLLPWPLPALTLLAIWRARSAPTVERKPTLV